MPPRAAAATPAPPRGTTAASAISAARTYVPAPDIQAWRQALAAWLAVHKTYPDKARARGLEGSVVLRFTADRSGRVLDVVLVRGAGSSLLDFAAEAMLRNATLPPLPSGMAQDSITVTLQIRYSLTD